MDFLKSTTKALWKNAKQNADGTYDLNLKDGTYISAKGKMLWSSVAETPEMTAWEHP